MKNAPASCVLALIAALVGGACATSAGGSDRLQLTVGRATRPDILDKVPHILDQQGYEVAEQQNTGNMIRYMSTWVTRAPFQDEADRGASESRTRLTFEARQQAGETFNVTIRLENMVHRSTMLEEWVTMPPTPMLRSHLKEISDALALEIDMGVRTR